MPDATLPGLFHALADPTRLAIVERLLAEGDHTAGEIAAPFKVSKPAISRHLKVLADAGLVERAVDRQWRIVRIRPETMQVVDDWIAKYRAHWQGAFERLDRLFAARAKPEA